MTVEESQLRQQEEFCAFVEREHERFESEAAEGEAARAVLEAALGSDGERR
jgi:hypothetical protein